MISVKQVKDWLAQFPDDARVEIEDGKDRIIVASLKVITHFDGDCLAINTIGIE